MEIAYFLAGVNISILSDWEDGRRAVDQAWLDSILSSSSDFEHIFVMSHHPMQELGGVEGAFWESLVGHHVDVYFCGHWHEYNRSQPGGGGTWQVIVGTAGAPLLPFSLGEPGMTIAGNYGFLIVEVAGASVKVTFYSDAHGDGHYKNVWDSFVLSRPSHTEELAPATAPVSASAPKLDRPGCLMPSF